VEAAGAASGPSATPDVPSSEGSQRRPAGEGEELPEGTARWRCVTRNLMVVCTEASLDAPIARTLRMGEEIQAASQPEEIDGRFWLKLTDGTFALTFHEAFGELLQRIVPTRGFELSSANLEQALEVAAQCGVAEKVFTSMRKDWTEKRGCVGATDWEDSTWTQLLELQPILALAAQPAFAPPPRFQQSMEACMACLLHVPDGRVHEAWRLVQLLDSEDAIPLVRYLEWLEEALQKVSPSSSSGCSTSCRTVLVAQRVQSAVSSWSAERALLQQSSTALVETLLTQGPQHQGACADWRKTVEDREAIQAEQEEACQDIAREIDRHAYSLQEQLREASGAEWPQMQSAAHASLLGMQQLTGELIEKQQECFANALAKDEALGVRQKGCQAIAGEARRLVRRREQAFAQAASRFTEVASQLVAWTSVLAPKLRLLEARREELRKAVELRRRLPILTQELLSAEDELDTAQTELRKCKRHSQALRSLSHRDRNRPDVTTTANSVLERQCEVRVARAGERTQALAVELCGVERALEDVEAQMRPLVVLVEAEEESVAVGAGSGAGHSPTQLGEAQLSSEERLALKLAALEQVHEDLFVQASEVEAQRKEKAKAAEKDVALPRIARKQAEEALRAQVEPDFMCPIMHERMCHPVLAADGYTYERYAIERWLQMHNTSPMTGAPLAHRYLTENFALKHLIAAYEAAALSAKGDKAGGGGSGAEEDKDEEDEDDDEYRSYEDAEEDGLDDEDLEGDEESGEFSDT